LKVSPFITEIRLPAKPSDQRETLTMFIRDSKSRLLAIGTLFAGLCSLEAVANGCAALAELPTTLEMRARMHQQLQLPVAATRLAVGNPGVAEVGLLTRGGVLLGGKGPGMTTVSVWPGCSKERLQPGVWMPERPLLH